MAASRASTSTIAGENSRLQQGQQQVPDPVPRERRIRGSRHPPGMALLARRATRGPRPAGRRAADGRSAPASGRSQRALAGRRRESAAAGTSRPDRRRVPGRDAIGGRRGGPIEERVPGAAAGVLERGPPRLGRARDVDALHDERDAETPPRGSGRTPRRRRPSARRPWLRCATPATVELASCLQLAKQVQQRDRVRAARERHEHTSTRAQHRVPANRRENPIGEGHAAAVSRQPAIVWPGPAHEERRIDDLSGWRWRQQKWWRCRDLNPGHCGYEPHALTS